MFSSNVNVPPPVMPLNLPLPPGLGDADYEALMAGVIEPVVDAFAPELIIVSAGFDTYALTNATLPYVLELALHGPAEATRADPSLRYGCNTVGGHVTNAAVAEFLGVDLVEPATALAAV